MRGFLAFCFIAVASGQYNYAPSSGPSLSGTSLSVSRPSYTGGSGSYSGGSYSGSSYSGGSIGAGSINTGFISGGHASGSGSSGSYHSGGFSSSGSSGSYSSGSGFSSSGSSQSSYTAPSQTITELNKEFYLYSAPEEHVQQAAHSHSSTTTLKKNLRVIFIKAPENNAASNAALQIAKQITEDQTAIYVLTKQNDPSEITHQLQQISEVHSQKPEVRFIKYRTPQDALNAQRTIQAQYDALGGSSKSSDEGVAPVLNYATSGSVSKGHSSGSQFAGSIAAGSSLSSQKSYLPPAV